MKHIHKLFITLYFVTQTTAAYSQTINSNVIPPSPKAQELLRFGDIPVSLHAGVPQISIPIYTVSLKDFSFPISLDYNASGIKVEQEAGQAGLGWAINAEGVISHSIRGFYDFADSYYLNTSGDNMGDIKGLYNIPSPVILDYNKPLSFSLATMTKLEFFRRLSNTCLDYGGIDFCPDIFSYSIPGYSGKFIFSHDHEIIKEKTDNVIITPVRELDKRGIDYLKSFILTTPEGNKYYFEQTEQANTPNKAICYGGKYNSAYYLTKIVTPGNSQIEFKYKKNGTFLGTYNKIQAPDYGNRISIDYTHYDNCLLDEIVFPGGQLDFNYKLDRDDLPGQARIDYIELSGSGKQIRWNFIYGYFVANTSTTEIPSLPELKKLVTTGNYTEDWNKKRLKLTAIEKVAGTDKQTYRFSYNESALPTKLSSAQDHWGYFNNAKNSSLIPTIYHNESQDGKTVTVKSYGNGADRESNSYCQAFILNRIYYPTGGSSRFIFEQNTYRADNFENDPYKKDFFYRKFNRIIKEGEYAHNIGGDWIDTASIALPVVTSDKRALYDARIKVELDNSFNYAAAANKILHFRLMQNGIEAWSFDYQTPYTPSSVNGSNNTFEKTWKDIKTPAGMYIMQVYGPMRSYIKNIEFEVSGQSAPESYLADPVKTGGGLRIGQIVTLDETGSYLHHKKFIYNEGGSLSGREKVTGKLMEYPRYLVRNGDGVKVTSCGIHDNGYSVGYSEVSVIDYDKSGTALGKTTSSFINSPNTNLYYSWDNTSLYENTDHNGKDINPPGTEQYKNPANGILSKVVSYGYESGKFIPMSKTEYKYSGIGGLPATYWGVVRDFDDGESVCASDAEYKNIAGSTANTPKKTPIGYLYPALMPYQSFLDNETETLYCGTDSIVTYTKYTRNAAYLIASKTVSTGQTRDISRYSYPTDYPDDTVMQQLVSCNRISNPVMTVSDRNGVEQKTEQKYKLFNGMPQVAQIMTNSGASGDMEVRSECTRYDSHGNMSEVVNTDGTTTVYLWSYAFQYPVAEIRNASYNDVVSALGISTEALGKTLDPPMESVNALRTRLSGALVTTYTYNPLDGISTVTDPAGVTVTYGYDPAGRLSCIRDMYGNVQETFNYHYKK